MTQVPQDLSQLVKGHLGALVTSRPLNTLTNWSACCFQLAKVPDWDAIGLAGHFRTLRRSDSAVSYVRCRQVQTRLFDRHKQALHDCHGQIKHLDIMMLTQAGAQAGGAASCQTWPLQRPQHLLTTATWQVAVCFALAPTVKALCSRTYNNDPLVNMYLLCLPTSCLHTSTPTAEVQNISCFQAAMENCQSHAKHIDFWCQICKRNATS